MPDSWGKFDEETAWFIYDFVSTDLKPIDMLIFYGYYIKGFTLKELGERVHLSFQAVDMRVKKINRQLNEAHSNMELWRKNREHKRRDKQSC